MVSVFIVHLTRFRRNNEIETSDSDIDPDFIIQYYRDGKSFNGRLLSKNKDGGYTLSGELSGMYQHTYVGLLHVSSRFELPEGK